MTSPPDEGAHQNAKEGTATARESQSSRSVRSRPLTVPQNVHVHRFRRRSPPASPLLLPAPGDPLPPPHRRPPWSPSSRPTRCPTDPSFPPHARCLPSSLLSLASSPSFVSQPISCPHPTSPTSLRSAFHPTASVEHVRRSRGPQASGCPRPHQRPGRTSRSRRTRTSSSGWRAARVRESTGGISPRINRRCTTASLASRHGDGLHRRTVRCVT